MTPVPDQSQNGFPVIDKRLEVWRRRIVSRHGLLVVILAAAAVFRFAQIEQTMRFSGDEGRDALIVLHFVRDHTIPVVGPSTSIGGVMLGPLYYYLIAGPMAVTGNNPVAAAVVVALFGIATVWLVYLVTKELFDSTAGLIAAALYAVAYSPVVMSKSSWNPYPVAFFVLAFMFALVRAIRGHNPAWLILAGVAYSCVVQLHGMGLVLLPLLLFYWVVGFQQYRRRHEARRYLAWTGLGCLAFAAVLFPYIVHEVRQDFPDVRAFVAVFTHGSAVSFNLLDIVGRLRDSYSEYVQHILVFGFRPYALFIAVLLPVAGLVWLVRKQAARDRFSLILLGLWFVSGLGGLALLATIRSDHYYNIVTPVGFLLLAALIRASLRRSAWRVFGAAMFLVALGTSLWVTPFSRPPWELGQLARTETVTSTVLRLAGEEPFAFRFIASDNYDAAYRFFFDRAGRLPVDQGAAPSARPPHVFYVCERQGCNDFDQVVDEQLRGQGYGVQENWVFADARLIHATLNP